MCIFLTDCMSDEFLYKISSKYFEAFHCYHRKTWLAKFWDPVPPSNASLLMGNYCLKILYYFLQWKKIRTNFKNSLFYGIWNCRPFLLCYVAGKRRVVFSNLVKYTYPTIFRICDNFWRRPRKCCRLSRIFQKERSYEKTSTSAWKVPHCTLYFAARRRMWLYSESFYWKWSDSKKSSRLKQLK